MHSISPQLVTPPLVPESAPVDAPPEPVEPPLPLLSAAAVPLLPDAPVDPGGTTPVSSIDIGIGEAFPPSSPLHPAPAPVQRLKAASVTSAFLRFTGIASFAGPAAQQSPAIGYRGTAPLGEQRAPARGRGGLKVGDLAWFFPGG